MMNLKNIQLMPEKNLLRHVTNALRKFILDEIDKVAEAHQERKKTEIQKKQKENINNFQRNLEKVFKENSLLNIKSQVREI